MYEAGHNVFGQWSLNALQQKFSELSTEFCKQKEDRNLGNAQQDFFSESELQKQIYFPSKRTKKMNKQEKA